MVRALSFTKGLDWILLCPRSGGHHGGGSAPEGSRFHATDRRAQESHSIPGAWNRPTS